MKKHFISVLLFFISVLMIFNTCNSSVNNIHGKWTIETIIPTDTLDKDDGKDAGFAAVAFLNISAIGTMYDFVDDKQVVISKDDKQIKEGTYTYDAAERKIIFTEEGGEKLTYTILEHTNDLLKLKSRDSSNVIIIFKKSK